MSSSEYVIVWSIYLASGAVVVGCFWWVTEPIRNETVKWVLRLPIIAVVITPAPQGTDSIQFSPAIAAAALDMIAGGWEGARLHVVSLLVTIILSLILFFVIQFIHTKRKKPEESNP